MVQSTHAQNAKIEKQKLALRRKIRSLVKNHAYSRGEADYEELLALDAEYEALEAQVQSGRCRKCGRVLTDPASVSRGYGPECWKQIEHLANAQEDSE